MGQFELVAHFLVCQLQNVTAVEPMRHYALCVPEAHAAQELYCLLHSVPTRQPAVSAEASFKSEI
jgi:hypothetical protein